jgi:hypothetical protein
MPATTTFTAFVAAKKNWVYDGLMEISWDFNGISWVFVS